MKVDVAPTRVGPEPSRRARVSSSCRSWQRSTVLRGREPRSGSRPAPTTGGAGRHRLRGGVRRRRSARARKGIVNQKRRLRPVLVLLLVAAVAVLGLAWAMEAAGAESASPAADASADAGKVIYKVGWTRQPDNLNPFIGFESPAFEMWYLTYDSLVGYDPETLSPMKGEELHGPRHRLDGQRRRAHLDVHHPPEREVGRRRAAHRQGRRLHLQLHHREPDQTSNLTAYTNLIEKATAIDDYTVRVRVLQAQAGHDPPLGAHPARAHLVQDPDQGRGEELPEQPALRGLRPLHSASSGRRTTTSSSSPTPPGGARSPRSTSSTSRTTPTATPCCRTSRPAPSTAPAT